MKTFKLKEPLLFILFAILLICVVGLLVMHLMMKAGKPNISTVTPLDNPPVSYNIAQTKKMELLVREHKELSSSDASVRKMLTKRTNPLQETNTFSIEYLSAPNEFMVEIKSANIQKAKIDAVTWLMNQGLTQDGVCHLPVIFYLNYNVAQSLRGTKTEFDPLAPGC